MSENLTGLAMPRTSPMAGCSICTIRPRAKACASRKASGTVIIGAAGMLAFANLSSQAARDSKSKRSCKMANNSERIAGEPRIRTDRLLGLQDLHEFLPQPFRAYGDHKVCAVLCSKNLVGNDVRMSVSPASRFGIGIQVAAADVR